METRGDAEEPTETRGAPQRQAARWREKARPTGRRKVPSREVGEEPKQSMAKRKQKPFGGAYFQFIVSTSVYYNEWLD